MERLVKHIHVLYQSCLGELNSYDPSLTLGAFATVVSLLAVYLGTLFFLNRREAPVTFDVPLPAELRSDWVGTNWDELRGEELRILEAQSQGVSSAHSVQITRCL
jgi:hypothetical protein